MPRPGVRPPSLSSWRTLALALVGFLALTALVASGAMGKPSAKQSANPRKGLGPVPKSCSEFAGQEGCYGGDFETGGQKVMDDAGNGSVAVKPHILRVGQKLTATVAPYGEGSSGFVGGPGLKQVGQCGGTTCTYKAIAATNGWALYEGTTSTAAGTGVEQDYYAVIDEDSMVTGYVRDGDGAGIAEARIHINGKRRYAVSTDSAGYYFAIVAPGRYQVRPVKRGEQFAPPRSKVRVGRGATARANFRAGGYQLVSGKVRRKCGAEFCSIKGVAGARVLARGNGKTYRTRSGRGGGFKLRLPHATYRLRVKARGVAFEPARRTVVVRDSPVKGQSFAGCPLGPGSKAHQSTEFAGESGDCEQRFVVLWRPHDGITGVTWSGGAWCESLAGYATSASAFRIDFGQPKSKVRNDHILWGATHGGVLDNGVEYLRDTQIGGYLFPAGKPTGGRVGKAAAVFVDRGNNVKCSTSGVQDVPLTVR